jgi:hypothetical protein
MTTTARFLQSMRECGNRGALWSFLKMSLVVAALAILGFLTLITRQPGAGLGTRLLGNLVLLFAATLLYAMVRRYKKWLSPLTHPMTTELATYGDSALVGAEIEKEFAGQHFTARQLYAKGEWACYAGKGQIVIRRLDQLVWAYDEQIRHRINGLIPYRPSSHQLILWDRTGRGAALPLSKNKVVPALTALRSAAPWAFLGYNEALKESWNQDRREFIALVEQRRASRALHQP